MRQNSPGHPPTGNLPHRLNWFLFLLLHTEMPQRFTKNQGPGAFALITAVMVLVGCVKPGALFIQNQDTDSLAVHINSLLPYDHLDILIYEDTLTQPLKAHYRLGSDRHFHLPCAPGDKIIAALADLDGVLTEDKIPGSFSVLEQLTMNYADENPDAPLQSALASVSEGQRCELTLLPLLCSVDIGNISIVGDSPLLDPVVQLVGVNAYARVFQYTGFHPTYTLESPQPLKYPLMMIREIPFDIGNTPRMAGVRLYCYPNEDEDGPWRAGTSLLVSGNCRTEKRQFRIPLGAISRGAKICMDVELKSSNYD